MQSNLVRRCFLMGFFYFMIFSDFGQYFLNFAQSLLTELFQLPFKCPEEKYRRPSCKNKFLWNLRRKRTDFVQKSFRSFVEYCYICILRQQIKFNFFLGSSNIFVYLSHRERNFSVFDRNMFVRVVKTAFSLYRVTF